AISSRCGVLNAGERQQWNPVSGISSSPPNTALLTNRKSPMRSVFSMLAEGIRNASTRNDRITIQMSSAAPIAFTHAMNSSLAVLAFGGDAGWAEVGGGGEGLAGRGTVMVSQSSRR